MGAVGVTPCIADATPRPCRSLRVVNELERPKAPGSLKVVGLIGLGLLAWLLFGSALSVVRAGIALIGYVVVGFVAFQAGKFIGRHDRHE